MKRTNNLNLPIYEGNDKFYKEDLNNANIVIDQKIADLQETINTAAGGNLTIINEVISARGGEATLKDRIDKIGDNTEEITAIETDLSGVKSRVATAEGNITSVNNEINAARGASANLKANIDRIESLVPNKANTEAAISELTTARGGKANLNLRIVPIEDKLKSVSYYTPEQYGAIGNGTNDDTAALQAMITAINTAAKTRTFTGEASCKDWSEFKMVFGKRYFISAPLVFNNTYGLTLDELRLTALSNFTGDGMVKLSGVSRNTKISNMTLNCNLYANTGLYIQDYTVTTDIINIEVTRFKKYGLYAINKGHELKMLNGKINQVEWGDFANIGTLVTEGTGIYLGAERHDNNFTNVVVNYCKDYLMQILGGSNQFMNMHYYSGKVLNQGYYNFYTDNYFDNASFHTMGEFNLKGCFLSFASNTAKYIYFLETAANEWRYDGAKIVDCTFKCDSQNTAPLDYGLIGKLPRMYMSGNSFNYVTPFIIKSSIVVNPMPWYSPVSSGGDSTAGWIQYGDYVRCWGTITGEDGFVTFPNNYSISTISEMSFVRLDSASTSAIFPNSIQATKFWVNGVGAGSSVRWYVGGRV